MPFNRWSLHHRATAAGTNSLPLEVSPSSYSLGEAYPFTRNGITFGHDGTAPTRNDRTATDQRLGGYHVAGSAAVRERIDLPDGPGTYKVWLALGDNNLANGAPVIIADGNGTNGAAGTQLFDVKSVANGGTAPTAGSVLDAAGQLRTKAAWLSLDGGTPRDVTFTADHFWVIRSDFNYYVLCVEWQKQAEPLQDAYLSSEDQSGAATSIWSKEPAGKKIGRVSSPVGAQTFSVVGGAAPYYTVQMIDGVQWLVTTATRIPDAFNGSITIRQTDGDGTTKDTAKTLTVNLAPANRVVAPSLAVPKSSYLALISSETYFERERVRAVTRGEQWAGYTGQTIAGARDVAIAGDAAFKAAYDALTPDGTSWYRFRLQPGSWTNNYLSLNVAAKNFGSGGLLIEPDAGADPQISTQFVNLNGDGVHVRNLLLVPPPGNTGYSFYCSINCTSSRLRLESLRVGLMHVAGETKANWQAWGSLFNIEFCKSVQMLSCDFNGVRNVCIWSGGRSFLSALNRYRNVTHDFHGVTPAYRRETPKGSTLGQPDDHSYVEICDNHAYANPDIYEGLVLTAVPHGDWLQGRRLENFYAYGASGRPDNRTSSDTVWTVGRYTANLTENRLYTVSAVTTGVATGAAPPSGTGTGMVDSGVTWDYAGPYNARRNLYALMENNTIHENGQSKNVDGGSTSPNVQYLIASFTNQGFDINFTLINERCGTSSSRGVDAGDGKVNVEYCSFMAPNSVTTSLDTPGILAVDGGKVRARRCFLGYSASGYLGKNIQAPSIYDDGCVAIDWKTQTGTRRPQDLLRGSFTYANGGWGYTLNDAASVDRLTFESDFSKQLHAQSGAVGARGREQHTVTFQGGSAGALVIEP